VTNEADARVSPAPAKDYVRAYLDTIEGYLERIYNEQRDMIRRCAAVIADRIAEDGLIYVFGSGGHSNMMAEEMFHRAGGLACVSPVFVDSIRMPHVPLGERSPGIVPYVFDFYGIGKDDVLILVNAYGINPVTIESALEAKKRGVKVIAITSTDYAQRIPKGFIGRHESGLNLHELFEHTLLTYAPYGDAIVEMDGVASRVGPYSTFANAFLCNSLVMEASALLVERGIDPPLINSINTLGGAEKNQIQYAKYRPRVRWL
jgi:uncharacterized phosphosugar-binding protein